MASNSSRTSDFGQNGVLLLPLFRPLYVHVDQEIDLPSNPEAGGDLGGYLEAARRERDASVRPPGTRLRGGGGAGMRFNAIKPPKKFLPSCVNMSRRSMPPFWEKKRCIPLVFYLGEGIFRSLAGHIWHQAAAVCWE